MFSLRSRITSLTGSPTPARPPSTWTTHRGLKTAGKDPTRSLQSRLKSSSRPHLARDQAWPLHLSLMMTLERTRYSRCEPLPCRSVMVYIVCKHLDLWTPSSSIIIWKHHSSRMKGNLSVADKHCIHAPCLRRHWNLICFVVLLGSWTPLRLSIRFNRLLWRSGCTFTDYISLALEYMSHLYHQQAGKCNNSSGFAAVEWNSSCPSSESASWLLPPFSVPVQWKRSSGHTALYPGRFAARSFISCTGFIKCLNTKIEAHHILFSCFL